MFALLRFFHIVDGVPLWMGVLTMTLAAYSVAVVWIDPRGADDALGALLLWQMLSASRGFVRPASAGYFDPMLVRESRRRIALAHFAYAAAPVFAVWVVVALMERALGVMRPLALEPGRLAAFAFVSAVAWGSSLGASRLVTGALWIGVLVALAVTPVGLAQYTALLQRPEGAAQMAHALAAAMVCPFVMIDVTFPMRAAVAAGLTIAALVAMLGGMAFITRRSYSLEPEL